MIPHDRLIFEAGIIQGLIQSENEREMEIIGHCFGHCSTKSIAGGTNVVIEARQPKSKKRREGMQKNVEELLEIAKKL